MNNRLNCILSFIRDGLGLIDVGTDHGYLPVELCRKGYSGRLFASDINRGPLHAAMRTADMAGVQDRIAFQLADGLEACDPDLIDTIVIAGMGGDTICGILDRAEWCMNRRYTLVLQPMTRAEVLRYWLVYNEFEICNEKLVEDGGVLYSVLVARFGRHTELTDAELYTGEYSKIRDDALFPAFLAHQISRFEKILVGLQHASKNDINGRTVVLEHILAEMKGMKQSDEKLQRNL